MEPTTIDDRDANPFNRLPNEILEIIFSHIKTKILIANVLPVCRRFYWFLSNERLWFRKLKDHPLNIQLCDAEMNSTDFSVVRTFDAIVAEQKRCENWNEKERYTAVTGRDYVDAIKLFKSSGSRYCLSAAKDSLSRHSFKLWSLDKIMEGYAKDDSLLFECDSKVDGEVGRDIAMHTDQQFAANIHHTVQLWDIGQSAIRKVSTRQFDKFVGAVCVSDGILACSAADTETIDTNVYLLDVRNGLQEISLSTYYVPAMYDIMSLHLKGNLLYMFFEHKLVMADIRKLNVPIHTYQFDKVSGKLGYISMDVSDGLILCCNHGGNVVVLGESDLRPCYTFQVEREWPYTSFMSKVIKGKGSVLTLTRTTLRAYSLGSQPVQLGYYDKFQSRPIVIDALDGDIAVGSLDGSITAWTRE